jgi:hypothetical protein
MKPVMNIDEVKFDDVEENGLYASSHGQISDHIGAKKLGYNLTVPFAARRRCNSCPTHRHHNWRTEHVELCGLGQRPATRFYLPAN